MKHLATIPHPDVKRLPERSGGGASKSYADDYETWFKFGLAMYRTFGDDGFDAWDAWSRSSDTYRPEVMQSKWASFAGADRDNNVVSVGSIFYAAKRNGWSYGLAQTRIAFQAAREKFYGSAHPTTTAGNEQVSRG